MEPSPDYPPQHFQREEFYSNAAEIHLHMSHFFLKYLGYLQRAFDGDFVKAIVLGEIAHHNLNKQFSEHNVDVDFFKNITALDRDALEGCNAFSVSQSTGIPRETARRKVNDLLAEGLLEEHPGGGLRVTAKCAEHYTDDTSVPICDLLLKSAANINRIFERERTMPPSAS